MVDIPIQKREISIITNFLKRNELTNLPYVEVGCGDGSNLKVFSENWMTGYGIDISQEAISLSNKKNLMNTTIIRQNFLEFEKTVELVFMINVLEHTDNYTELIDRAYEILDYYGFLIVGVPINKKAFGYADRNAGHRRRFCEKQLLDELKDKGFNIIKTHHVGFPVSDFYTYIFNLLNKNRKVNPKNTHSGIRHKENYYPSFYNTLSRILFPVLTHLIKIDALFSRTKLGNNIVIFCNKRK